MIQLFITNIWHALPVISSQCTPTKFVHKYSDEDVCLWKWLHNYMLVYENNYVIRQLVIWWLHNSWYFVADCLVASAMTWKIIWELDQVSTMAAEALATCVTRPLSVHTWLEISTHFHLRYPHIFTWLIKFDSFWNWIYIEFRRKLCLNLLAWLTLLLAPGCWQYQVLCSVNCDIKSLLSSPRKNSSYMQDINVVKL